MRMLLLLTVLLFSVVPPADADINNKDALSALSEVKAVFDINQGDPEVLKLRLNLIKESYDQLIIAGIKPVFVLTFRGKASFFLTQGNRYIADSDLIAKNEIQKLIQELSLLQFPMEQCGIAARLSKINPDDFYPEIRVVTNGYVSLMGYQNRGYAFIPME